MKKIINSPKAPNPVGPYNQAVLAGDTLYISGQIAIDSHSGNIINHNIEDETKQVLDNLNFILEEAGLSLEHIVKCSVFVSDMKNYARINEVYLSYFGEDNAPARELVEVSALPKYVNVEISAIAVLSK
jgi:2-iminobutanoate/2-iminopropanoate deaminase